MSTGVATLAVSNRWLESLRGAASELSWAWSSTGSCQNADAQSREDRPSGINTFTPRITRETYPPNFPSASHSSEYSPSPNPRDSANSISQIIQTPYSTC